MVPRLPAGWPKYLICFLLLLVATPWGVAAAQTPDPPYDEAEAQAIDRMLMCPVCPAETIDQAQVELARQMRQKVREMLAQGASREEVLGYFVDRYGPGVLAAPPRSGINLVAWIFPAVGVVVALGAGLVVLRSMTGRTPRGPDSAAPPADNLEPYLQMVDRDLALSQGQGDALGQSTGPAATPEGTSAAGSPDVERQRGGGCPIDG